jgi:hypothetical protein
MDLNALLREKNIDPTAVAVLRHRPQYPELRRVLPWLAAERPDSFNAYQQTHGPKVEKALQQATYTASFIGHAAGQAIFVGIFKVVGWTPITEQQFWKRPGTGDLRTFGMDIMDRAGRETVLWFDLQLTDIYADWKGKLIVNWPPPERAWWRWASRNTIPIAAILPESAFDEDMPSWDKIDVGWEELKVLPTRWRHKLSEWRAIYYIFDTSDRKGYVGSAYGSENLLGRWLGYGAVGHGGNKLLRQREPKNFRFSILQRLSPDLEPGDVVAVESSWKERLHTREPWGLNDN